jgi:phosphoribosylformimino-5-aminoimidazole carboxamide ribotide isomerase
VILYPSIDLKDGACVRLVRGEMETATVFNRDPAAQARDFAALGFRWLHVVDLDGSFAGGSVNGEAVRAIRRAIDLKMQLGGGIRERAAIDAWLDIGVRDGRVAVQGWGETSDVEPAELARRFADAGVAAIVYTDVGRDGALAGIDVDAIAGFAREAGIPVIASGGVSSLDDIAALKAYAADGIAGIIVGRALYDGRIDAKAALRIVGEDARC